MAEDRWMLENRAALINFILKNQLFHNIKYKIEQF